MRNDMKNNERRCDERSDAERSESNVGMRGEEME